MGKPSGSGNTVTQQSGPPANVLQNYQNVYNTAQGLTQQPWANVVAPFNTQQQTGIANAQNLQYDWQPYGSNSNYYYGQAAQPLSSQISSLMSPYTSDVVNATQKQFANQNAIQQQGVIGNAVAQGAWGGDRSAVAQGITAGQQQLAEAPTIAGLENTGFQTALSGAEAQSYIRNQAAAGIGNLGMQENAVNSGQVAADLQAGGLEQQQAQAYLNIPYQQTGWLSNIAEGLGSQSGGTSSTQYPSPSAISQAAGLGIGGLGVLGATGGFGANGYLTGSGGLLSGIGSLFSGGAALGAPTTIGDLATTLGFAAARGGRLPHWNSGGGIPHRDDGGSISGGIAPAAPPGGITLPRVAISVMPMAARQGIGPPRPPMGMSPQQEQQATGQNYGQMLGNIGTAIKTSGVMGQRRGGAVRRYADGGEFTPASPLSAKLNNYSILREPEADELSPAWRGAAEMNNLTIDLRQELKDKGFRGFATGGIVSRYADGGDLVSGIAPPSGPGGMIPDIPPEALALAGIGGSGGAPTSSGYVPRDMIVNYWTNQGYPEHVANGIADAMSTESGVKGKPGMYDPTAVNPDSGATGLLQDLGSRKQALLSQPNWQDPKTQLDFANSELNTTEKTTRDALMGAKTEPEAKQLFRHYFERPGIAGGDTMAAAPSRGVGPSPSAGAQPYMMAPVTGGTGEPSGGIVPGSAATPPPSGMDALRQPGVDPWLALAAAGFGMASGTSPFPGVNIGRGAMEGLNFLENERMRLPEQRLQTAQAAQAEMTAGLTKAQLDYYHNHNVNALNSNIAQAGKDLAAPGNAQLRATDGGSSQTPTMTTLPNAGIQVPAGGNPADPLIQRIDEGYRQLEYQAGAPMLPAQHAAIQEQITRLMESDPRVAAAKAGMSAAAELPYKVAQAGQTAAAVVGPHIQEAGGKAAAELPYKVAQAGQTAAAELPYKVAQAGQSKAAELPYTVTTARPGGYVLQGGQPVAAVPIQRNEVDPTTGAEYPRFVTPPLPGAIAGAGTSQASPTGAPPAGVAATPAGIPSGTMPLKLGPGQEESLKKRAEDEQNLRDETLKEAGAAQLQQSTLNVIKQNAADTYTGPGADYVGDFNKIARLVDPNYDNTVAARESLNKNGGQLIRQATRELSPRAAFQEVQFVQSTLPNQDMSPKGLALVTGELQGLNDYKIAKAKAMADWETQHGGVGQVAGFESDWQARPPVTPYTFIIQRMPQADRQAMFAKWNTTPEGRAELQKLRGQVQYAVQNGLNP